jgi:hypothetical protein
MVRDAGEHVGQASVTVSPKRPFVGTAANGCVGWFSACPLSAQEELTSDVPLTTGIGLT